MSAYTFTEKSARRIVSAVRRVERERGSPSDLRWGGRTTRPADGPYEVTGVGTATVSIAAGTLIVIHFSATDETATTVTAATGTLYREYTYSTGTWGSWTIGTPTEAATKRVFRRATITVTSGLITAITPLAFGNLEVYRATPDCV